MNNAIKELRKRVDDLKCLADMEQRNEGSDPVASERTTACFLAKREGILEALRTIEESDMACISIWEVERLKDIIGDLVDWIDIHRHPDDSLESILCQTGMTDKEMKFYLDDNDAPVEMIRECVENEDILMYNGKIYNG